MNNPYLMQIGEEYNKTVGQVVLWWSIDWGFGAVPSPDSESKIEEYFKIFDFQLKTEEISGINKLAEICTVTQDV